MNAVKRSQTSPSSSPPSSPWIHLRSVLFIAASSNSLPALCSSSSSSSSSSSRRGRLKSPWSQRKRKHKLSPQQWRDFFTPDGKLRDNGVKFLKKVRSGGVDPSIRAEVWPFLLGVYDLTSSKEERKITRTKNRKEYEKLRRQCSRLLNQNTQLFTSNQTTETTLEGTISPNSEGIISARQSISSEDSSFHNYYTQNQRLPSTTPLPNVVYDTSDSNTSDSDPDLDLSQIFFLPEEEETPEVHTYPNRSREDFATWQRIIRLDAIRANEEWMDYNPSLAAVSDEKASRVAESVGLKDYNHLGASRMFHAARLVSILEAYTFYDPEIGYCQGMSDLLSPIISVMTVDHEAFWCFVGFMKKARHNFMLDEVGIRRQLNTVSRIIKHKDSCLYRHLEKLEAEDCFFVYRMVVVMFRRELSLEQTVCLWEVMWADQAAIRAGMGMSGWSRMRQRAPPTEDLLLYAIAASVLERRKMIVERYSSVDEILRECNGMAGSLDVWKLLDDAHGLVVALHDKIKD